MTEKELQELKKQVDKMTKEQLKERALQMLITNYKTKLRKEKIKNKNKERLNNG